VINAIPIHFPHFCHLRLCKKDWISGIHISGLRFYRLPEKNF
jgi:hypothetical protein